MIERRWKVAILLMAWVLLAGYQPAMATKVKPMTTQELVKESDLIIHGTVSKVASTWNQQGTVILTKINITLTKKLKGAKALGQTFQLIQLGGKMDNKRMTLVGDAKLKEGEEVVLFLKEATNNPDVNYWVTGMAQGKYMVQTDKATGTKSVIKEEEVTRVTKEKPGKPKPEAPTLEEFYQMVQKLSEK